MDEQSIIESLKKGNHHALSMLISIYGDMVFSIAVKIAKDYQIAEEIAQDTFVKVYQQIHRFRADAKFSTWLYKIALNTAYTKSKQRKPREINNENNFHTENLSDDGLQILLQQEKKERIVKAIKELPEVESIAISLYYLEEYSIKELSVVLDLSENYTKVKLHRARKLLKEKMISLNL